MSSKSSTLAAVTIHVGGVGRWAVIGVLLKRDVGVRSRLFRRVTRTTSEPVRYILVFGIALLQWFDRASASVPLPSWTR